MAIPAAAAGLNASQRYNQEPTGCFGWATVRVKTQTTAGLGYL